MHPAARMLGAGIFGVLVTITALAILAPHTSPAVAILGGWLIGACSTLAVLSAGGGR